MIREFHYGKIFLAVFVGCVLDVLYTQPEEEAEEEKWLGLG